MATSTHVSTPWILLRSSVTVDQLKLFWNFSCRSTDWWDSFVNNFENGAAVAFAGQLHVFNGINKFWHFHKGPRATISHCNLVSNKTQSSANKPIFFNTNRSPCHSSKTEQPSCYLGLSHPAETREQRSLKKPLAKFKRRTVFALPGRSFDLSRECDSREFWEKNAC